MITNSSSRSAPRPAGWWAACSIAALAAFIAGGCTPQATSEPPREPPPSVTATPVERISVASTAEYIGRTESISTIDLRARVPGFLERRNFEEGADVQEGDLLYVIEQAPYKAAVDAATAAVSQTEATLDNARKYLRRLEAVKDAGGAAIADIDIAERAVLEARAILNERQAQLTRAKLDMDYTEIRAPISGRIGRTAIHVGNLVGPDSGVLASIVKLDPMWVSFPISERDYLQLQHETGGQGEKGLARRLVPTIRLVDGTMFAYKGTLDFEDNRVDRATGTIMIRATFPNPRLLLRPGQFVTVLQTEVRTTQRLVIPSNAIQRDQVGPFVLLVNQERNAEVRRITLGEETGTKWIVNEGLTEGELVISDGVQKVIPGSPVNATQVSPAGGPEGGQGAK